MSHSEVYRFIRRHPLQSCPQSLARLAYLRGSDLQFLSLEVSSGHFSSPYQCTHSYMRVVEPVQMSRGGLV